MARRVLAADDYLMHIAAKLELELLDPERRRQTAVLERLLHADFAEVGASGRLWDRASVIAELADRPSVEQDVRDLTVRAVARGVVLVMYVTSDAADGARAARRASLWLCEGAEWKLLFHQGTRCGAGE